MLLKINGKNEEIQCANLQELLKAKDIAPQMVSIELNNSMIDRDNFDKTPLKDGDSIELLFFMGGGRRLEGR